MGLSTLMMRRRRTVESLPGAFAAFLFACGGVAEAPPLPDLAWRGDSVEAQEQLAGALAAAREHRSDGAAAGRLGMLLQAYDQNQGALRCYERAQALSPEDPRWTYLGGTVLKTIGRSDAARESFRRVLERDAGHLAARVRLADALLESGEARESQFHFEILTAGHPNSAVAHYGLGRASVALGEFEQAIESFKRASEAAPHAGGVSYALAMAYRDSGDAATASKLLTSLEGEDRNAPDWSDPWLEEVRLLRHDHHWRLSHGLRLEAEGRLEEAREQYARALQMKPDFAQAHVNLVSVFGKLGRFEQAEVHYRAALESDPEGEELHVNWGALEAARGRWRAAADSYRRALEINPSSAAAHVDLGMILLRQGKGADAEAHFESALKSEPANRLAHFHLGRRLVERGRVASGVDLLERSLEPVDDRTPTFLYGLADAYLRLGDVEQASERARRAHDLARSYGQHELAETISRGLEAIENAK